MTLRRDLSFLLGFRSPPARKRREQLAMFEAGPRQLHLGETAPYPAPPAPAVPVEPLFTGPAVRDLEAAPVALPHELEQWPIARSGEPFVPYARPGEPLEVAPGRWARSWAEANEIERRQQEHAAARRRLEAARNQPGRAAPRETYDAARDRLLAELALAGWDAHTRGPGLKVLSVPYATSPDRSHRIWFKPQAVWLSIGEPHALKGASSTMIDRRGMSAAELVRRLGYVAYIERMR